MPCPLSVPELICRLVHHQPSFSLSPVFVPAQQSGHTFRNGCIHRLSSLLLSLGAACQRHFPSLCDILLLPCWLVQPCFQRHILASIFSCAQKTGGLSPLLSRLCTRVTHGERLAGPTLPDAVCIKQSNNTNYTGFVLLVKSGVSVCSRGLPHIRVSKRNDVF